MARTPSKVGSGLEPDGRRLPADVRSAMESRFGYDFKDVRIHADGAAAMAAMRLQARAYTVGENIVLGPGEPGPASAHGRRLLAHELAHVVQQRRGLEMPGASVRAAETEADAAAERVAAGRPSPIRVAASPTVPLRQARKKPRGQPAPRVRQTLSGDQESWYVLDGFATKKAELTAGHKAIIQRAAEDLRAQPLFLGGSVRVIGHADQVPSEDPNNRALGQLRANAVRDALVAALKKAGVNDITVRAFSLGTQVPSVATPGAEPKNRRAIISITRPPPPRFFSFERQPILGSTPISGGRLGPIAPGLGPTLGLGQAPGPLLPERPGVTTLPPRMQRAAQKAGAPEQVTFEELAKWLVERSPADRLAKLGAALAEVFGLDRKEIEKLLNDAANSGAQAGLEEALRSGLGGFLGPPPGRPPAPTGLPSGSVSGEKIIQGPKIPISDAPELKVRAPRLRTVGQRFQAGGFIKFEYATASLSGPSVRIEILPEGGSEPVRDPETQEVLRVLVKPGVGKETVAFIQGPEKPGSYRLRMSQGGESIREDSFLVVARARP